MCSPSLVVGGISLAASAAGTMQQQRAAEASMDGVRQQQKLDREALLAQRKQIADSGSARAFDAKREAMIEEGRLIAAGSEAGGVGGAGLQVSALLQSYGFETGIELSRIARNTDNLLEQNARQLTSVDLGAANRIRAIDVNTPGLPEGVLGALGAGAQGFQTGKDLDPLFNKSEDEGPVDWT